jgi:hypothetical protein
MPTDPSGSVFFNLHYPITYTEGHSGSPGTPGVFFLFFFGAKPTSNQNLRSTYSYQHSPSLSSTSLASSLTRITTSLSSFLTLIIPHSYHPHSHHFYHSHHSLTLIIPSLSSTSLQHLMSSTHSLRSHVELDNYLLLSYTYPCNSYISRASGVFCLCGKLANHGF